MNRKMIEKNDSMDIGETADTALTMISEKTERKTPGAEDEIDEITSGETENSEDEDQEPDDVFFQRELDDDVMSYDKDPGSLYFSLILSLLVFAGAHDLSVTFPADIDVNDEGIPKLLPRLFTDSADKSFLAIQTRMDNHFKVTGSVRMKALIQLLDEDESLAGLVINPYTENIKIPRPFFIAVSDMYRRGWNDAKEDLVDEDEPETDAEEIPENVGFSVEVDCCLPVTPEQFTGLADMIRALRDKPYEHLTVGIKNPEPHDEVIFVQTAINNENGLYRVEIGFDMSDFDWDHPMILAKDDMSAEDTVVLFHEIFVNCTPTSKIPVITNEFRDIGFRGDHGNE